MKNITFYTVLLLSIYTLTGCHHRLVPAHNTQKDAPLVSQEVLDHPVINFETLDAHGKPELLGRSSEERLEQPPYDSWFVKNYNSYMIDTQSADQLNSRLAGKSFLLFMGTWCGDSQREIPRMFKLLDYCGVAPASIHLILVSNADSNYKQSPQHEEKGLDIFRVPDLLVLDGNREIGRIVESPVSSLEKDLLILTGGQPYTPQYKGADFLIHLFRKEPIDRIRANLPRIAEQIRPLLASPYELLSYSHVMQAAGEKDKADIASSLHGLLFPANKH